MSITFVMCSLLVAGGLAWFAEGVKVNSARYLALLSVVAIGAYFAFTLMITSSSVNFNQLHLLVRFAWIESFNIEYALAIDYLSLVLVSLTLFLALICILVSWHEIKEKVGFYYFNLLASIAGIIGVFTAVDMFLFIFF